MRLAKALAFMGGTVIGLQITFTIADEIREGPAQFLGAETVEFPSEAMQGLREDLRDRVGLIEVYKKGERFFTKTYLVRQTGQHLLNCLPYDDNDGCLYLGAQHDYEGDGEIDRCGSHSNGAISITREHIEAAAAKALEMHL